MTSATRPCSRSTRGSATSPSDAWSSTPVSSDLEIRDYRPTDAGACVDVFHDAVPWSLLDVPAWEHMQASTPDTARVAQWVAVRDGHVLGFAFAFLTWWTT